MRHFLRRHTRQIWGCHAITQRTTTTTTTTTRRAYHFTSPASDPATLRLYRILLRQCQTLQPAQEGLSAVAVQNQQQILLQPPLNPHFAGLSRSHPSSLTQPPTTAHHVLRLFGQWREQELSERAASLSSLSNHDDDDDDDDDDEIVKEEDKLIAWLGPAIAEQGADPWMDTSTLWTTPATIRQAIRLAFRHDGTPPLAAANDLSDTRAWAIRAYQYLAAQAEMHRLVRFREESGVRITTLARCVGRSASAQRSAGEPLTFKYRFVYRIRIENTNPDRVFQLLGRSWIIQESKDNLSSSSSSSETPKSVVFGDAGSSRSIKVHAPQTGAVGKHPVLEPGQFFEYMSGCDLATPQGIMKGSFHFAWVPAGTPSASVGQAVQALDESHAEKRFEVPVTPFPLQPDTLPVQFDP